MFQHYNIILNSVLLVSRWLCEKDTDVGLIVVILRLASIDATYIATLTVLTLIFVYPEAIGKARQSYRTNVFSIIKHKINGETLLN